MPGVSTLSQKRFGPRVLELEHHFVMGQTSLGVPRLLGISGKALNAGPGSVGPAANAATRYPRPAQSVPSADLPTSSCPPHPQSPRSPLHSPQPSRRHLLWPGEIRAESGGSAARNDLSNNSALPPRTSSFNQIFGRAVASRGVSEDQDVGGIDAFGHKQVGKAANSAGPRVRLAFDSAQLRGNYVPALRGAADATGAAQEREAELRQAMGLARHQADTAGGLLPQRPRQSAISEAVQDGVSSPHRSSEGSLADAKILADEVVRSGGSAHRAARTADAGVHARRASAPPSSREARDASDSVPRAVSARNAGRTGLIRGADGNASVQSDRVKHGVGRAPRLASRLLSGWSSRRAAPSSQDAGGKGSGVQGRGVAEGACGHLGGKEEQEAKGGGTTNKQVPGPGAVSAGWAEEAVAGLATKAWPASHADLGAEAIAGAQSAASLAVACSPAGEPAGKETGAPEVDASASSSGCGGGACRAPGTDEDRWREGQGVERTGCDSWHGAGCGLEVGLVTGTRSEEDGDQTMSQAGKDAEEEIAGREEVERGEGGDVDADLDGLESPTRRGRRAGKGGKAKKKESVYLGYCSNTSVILMRELLAKWGWRQVDDKTDCRFVWMDPSHANRLGLLTTVCKSQRVNFLPGMKEMCNKKPLYRRLNQAKRQGHADDIFFLPPTYVLPEDYEALEEVLADKKPKTYICKPDGGAQGNGIFLVRSGQEHRLTRGDKFVVQRYIHKPLLLDGYKFDLRLYVLITSVDPLRCYLFTDGLARFCTQPYAAPTAKNLDQTYMHLTNYSLNKGNKDGFIKYEEDTEEVASKRSVQTVLEQIASLGHDTDAIWGDIQKLCLRTVAATAPHLWQTYHSTVLNEEGPSMAFQIIGIDVMLDHQLRPFLLETNNGPSFNMDADIDRDIKLQVVEQALTMVKTMYRQPMPPPAQANGQAHGMAPTTEAEISGLRRRRWDAHLKAQAWESKCIGLEDQSAHYIPLEDDDLSRLFPLLRQDVMEAYEFAARLGDRDRKGLQPLSPPKLATALKYLGVLDGKRVTRAEVDLLYINLTKDLTGTAGKARDAADGVTLDMFGRALHAIAARLCPAAKTGVEAVCQMLEDCTRGRTAFDRGEE